MNTENRPFQDFLEAELLELRRNQEKACDRQGEEVTKWARMGTHSESEPLREATKGMMPLRTISGTSKESLCIGATLGLARERGQQSRPNV